MKKKKTSLKKRIFALVAVCLISVLTIVPCFADSGTYTNSIIGVPIAFDCYYDVYDSDIGGYTLYQYGGLLSYVDYSYVITDEFPSPDHIINVHYNSDNNSHWFTGSMSIFDFTNAAQYYNTEFIINCGNFLINPSIDDLTFNFGFNELSSMSISLAYTIFDDNSNGDINTYVSTIDLDEFFYYFSLSEVFTSLGVGDTDVFVYGLTISHYFARVSDINYIITFYESPSLIDRNINIIYMDTVGNITDIESNALTPIEEFFKALGIKDYKSAFENYTADYTSWIGNAVGGFLNMELMPYFSIGGVLLIIIAFGLVGYFLKVFMGG